MTPADEGREPGGGARAAGAVRLFGREGDDLVGKMSGGEQARLALALITRDAPHMLILDEPTNHLDVDAREALVQALNDYTGAVVIVSHDRHMIETTADRLVLVADGTAQEFDGNLDDYIALVLAKEPRRSRRPRRNKKEDRRAAAEAREKSAGAAQARATQAEAELAKLTAERSAIDRAMFDPSRRGREPRQADDGRIDEAPRRCAGASSDAREAEWLAASEALETA